jgi:hypothetical protein
MHESMNIKFHILSHFTSSEVSGDQESTRYFALIQGPSPATKAQLLSFNRTQSRVVIGLLTGHNTLRRLLYVMGLSNYSACRKCGFEEETSVHFCVGVRTWLH